MNFSEYIKILDEGNEKFKELRQPVKECEKALQDCYKNNKAKEQTEKAEENFKVAYKNCLICANKLLKLRSEICAEFPVNNDLMVKLLEESTNKKWKVVDIKGKNSIGENVRGFALVDETHPYFKKKIVRCSKFNTLKKSDEHFVRVVDTEFDLPLVEDMASKWSWTKEYLDQNKKLVRDFEFLDDHFVVPEADPKFKFLADAMEPYFNNQKNNEASKAERSL